MKTPKRKVVIDSRTTIFTNSTEPDDIVREKYLEKWNFNPGKKGNSMGKPSVNIKEE